MEPSVVITGGGTGGHVFPALAIAEELKSRGIHHISWIGSTRGMERGLVARWGIPFYGIPAGKLRRYLSAENLWDLFKTLAGIFRSIGILARLRPTLVFSKGGFVSVGPVLAAKFLGIPVVSHESDFDPGLATRINARFSRRVFVAYEESLRFYPPGKAFVTGNPVRREIGEGNRDLAFSLIGFSEDDTRPILFVQGGSLGARQINAALDSCLDQLVPHVRIVHQRGKSAAIRDDIPGSYLSRSFFTSEYPHILAAADIVMGRSGAGSLWEMGIMRKAGILVPLVEGSRGDQVRNAELCERKGSCIVIKDAESLGESIRDAVLALSNEPARRAAMGQAWGAFINADAAARGAALIDELVRARLAASP